MQWLPPAVTVPSCDAVGVHAVDDRGLAAGQGGGVAVRVHARTGGLDAHDLDRFVRQERVKQPDGVAAAAGAGDQQVGQTTVLLQDLARGPPDR